MRDDRITTLTTADAWASYHKFRPVFVVHGYAYSTAVYIFGIRIYQKGWIQ